MTTWTRILQASLILYLFIMGACGAAFVVADFPSQVNGDLTFPLALGSTDQGLLLLAIAAGVAGSFIHGAQSLSTYIGNVEFKTSWTAWYLVRPWIGGILGLSIYFAFRAGLVAGASVVNPYGVVALGLLGGWFSKTTSDKLQEVFETMFKTDLDATRKNKLMEDSRPIIDNLQPSPVPTGTSEICIFGRNFVSGAAVIVGTEQVAADFVSNLELKVALNKLNHPPAVGAEINIQVKNPTGDNRVSESRMLKFALPTTGQ